MLPTFCLRLATGVIASLLILSPAQINPRFYRTHFLLALGLVLVAGGFLYGLGTSWLWACLGLSAVLSLLASFSWSLENAPGGWTAIPLTTLGLGASLLLCRQASSEEGLTPALVADDFSSALLLGASMTAMLMGHSYLMAPSMSIVPLMHLLYALEAATLLRTAVAGVGLWFWTSEHSLAILTDVTLFLPLRWGLGFIGPAVLGFLAWQTARIRSTQSATGILYVVVIFCFLGELISQVLLSMTGFTL